MLTKMPFVRPVFGMAACAVLMLAGGAGAATINVSGGEPALTNAITTANADAILDEIVITDSSTYSPAAAFPLISNPLIIRAAAGQTPIIESLAASDSRVLRPTAEFYLIGAAPGTPMTIRQRSGNADTRPIINSGSGAGSAGYYYENLVIQRQATAGQHLLINNLATSHTLKNITFTGGASPTYVLTLAPGTAGCNVTMSNLDFSSATTGGSSLFTNQNVATISASNCKFEAPAGVNRALMFHDATQAINGTFTLTDCSFRADPAVTPLFYQTYGVGNLSNLLTLNLVRPTFTGPIGSIGFLIDTGGSVNITGTSAAAKASLTPVFTSGSFTTATLLLARNRGGSISLTDVACAAPPAPVVGLVDSIVLDTLNGLKANVNVTFNRCDLQSGLLGYHADTVNGANFAIAVTATNSVFNGAGASRSSLISLNGDFLSPSSVTLNHCTLFGSATSLVDVAQDSLGAAAARADTLTGNYSIFDGSAGLRCGNGALAGTRNVVKAGSSSTFTATPGDTRVAAGSMGLSATGRLSGSGPAVEYAIGSAQTVDVDGNTRPLGANKDSGASEVATADVAEWMLF